MTPDLLIALRTLEQQWRQKYEGNVLFCLGDDGAPMRMRTVEGERAKHYADQLAEVITQYEQQITTKTDDLLGNTAEAATGTELHAEAHTHRFELVTDSGEGWIKYEWRCECGSRLWGGHE